MEPRLLCGLDLPQNVWTLRRGDRNRATENGHSINPLNFTQSVQNFYACFSSASASSNCDSSLRQNRALKALQRNYDSVSSMAAADREEKT
jgi:hypothetical protein